MFIFVLTYVLFFSCSYLLLMLFLFYSHRCSYLFICVSIYDHWNGLREMIQWSVDVPPNVTSERSKAIIEKQSIFLHISSTSYRKASYFDGKKPMATAATCPRLGEVFGHAVTRRRNGRRYFGDVRGYV